MRTPRKKEGIERDDNNRTKVCKFPGCNEVIIGFGVRKFCKEHSKKEYYHELYHSKYKKKEAEELVGSNKIINHKFTETVIRKEFCDCCGEVYEIRLTPKCFVYPRYCPEHTNEYKRELYQKQKIIGAVK